MTESEDRADGTREACQAFVGLLVRAADETLDEHDRARLEVHLSGCEACRRALADQRAARAALLDLEPIVAPPFFAARVRAALDAESRGWLEERDFRRDTWRAAPVAAALILAAYLLSGQASAQGTGVTAVAGDQVSSTIRWSDAVSENDPLGLMQTAGSAESAPASAGESPQ